MTILLAAALAASQPMPWIDRGWLNDRAKVELLKPKAVAFTAPRRAQPAKAQSLLSSNLRVLGTVCSAAAKLPDPVGFLGELGTAYSMSPGQISALREDCAIYLAGRADSR